MVASEKTAIAAAALEVCQLLSLSPVDSAVSGVSINDRLELTDVCVCRTLLRRSGRGSNRTNALLVVADVVPYLPAVTVVIALLPVVKDVVPYLPVVTDVILLSLCSFGI